MKIYQNTDTPYILCSILNEATKRKQMSPDAVQALNKRAMEAAGIEATTNFSRHCDAKRTRTGPNRPEESAHGARQDVQYQNCTGEPPVEATDDEIEAPPQPFDWDRFRCPMGPSNPIVAHRLLQIQSSSVTTEADYDAGTVDLPSDDEEVASALVSLTTDAADSC